MILDSKRKFKSSLSYKYSSSFAVGLFAYRDKIKSMINFEVSVEHERIRKVR